MISAPAFATVTAASLVSTTSSKVLQLPLVIVHLKVAVLPEAKPVTVLVFDVGVVIVTAPLTILHKPVPVVAAVAANVKFPLLHCAISAPAIVPVGAAGA